MKAGLLLLFFILLVSGLNAQQLTTFHRGYNDTLTYSTPFGTGNYIASDIAEMPDGDFMATLNYGLMRTDNLGKTRWVMSYSAPGATPLAGYPASRQIVFSDILPLPGGDAIVLGALKGLVSSFQPDTAIVCRMAASGTITWCKTIMAPAPQSLQARGATLTANGELLVCLFSNFSPSLIGDYTIMMRMDLSGGVLWQRYLINNSTGSFNRQFRSWDVSECSNGDFLISGFGNNPDSNLVARLTGAGLVRWVKSYQCGNMTRRAFQRVREVTGGNIAVAMGELFTRHGNGYLLLDSTGNLGSVSKAFKDSAYYGNAIIKPNGDVVFATRTSMYKVDMAGNVVFGHRYVPPTGSPIGLTALCATMDGGYAAGGSYSNPSNNYRYYGYLVKTDGSGEAAPYANNFTPADTPCNCRMMVTSITDTAVNFPVSNFATSTTSIYMHDTLFALTLDVPTVPISKTLLVYPNPVKDILYFSSKAALNAGVYSSDGKLLLVEKGVRSMNVTTLPVGIYFIVLKDEKGTTISIQRLLKE